VLTGRYLREYQALGTAGGLYLFRDAILKGDPKTIIVMHSDVCCSFPLEDMLAMHTEKQAIGTMLGTKVSLLFCIPWLISGCT
jgi:mannose-1-phosphate guanylyltransferase